MKRKIYVRGENTEYEIVLKVILSKAHGRDLKRQQNEEKVICKTQTHLEKKLSVAFGIILAEESTYVE